ncbi:uncharacterized protein LOC134281804 [Saccostrea cucullata]|uniref:uncharacterized protein LOC134281804 n=1 Tax=Saccostrea cuccullata TaxID=36930 RepID=UPI002ED086E2
MILGAAFGGATFSMVVSILVFSLRKRSRQIEKAERLTENLETHTSMYESASGVSPFECNPISSRSSHGHVYNTVAETSPTSHIIPKVSHNTDPVVHQDNNDNTYLVLTGESDTSTIAAESHL